MTTWSKDKTLPTNLNNGNEYNNGDVPSKDTFNNANNNAFYAVDYAEALADTPDTNDWGSVGTPNVQLIDNVKDGKTYKKFKFSNGKGETGEIGLSVYAFVVEVGTSTPPSTITCINAGFIRAPKLSEYFYALVSSNLGYSWIGTYEVTSIPVDEQASTAFNGTLVNYMSVKGDAGENGLSIRKSSVSLATSGTNNFVYWSNITPPTTERAIQVGEFIEDSNGVQGIITHFDGINIFYDFFANLTGATGATGETGATGNGIIGIAKTGAAGLVDTYTVTFTNAATTTFTVTNGKEIANITINGLDITFTYTDSSTDTITIDTTDCLTVTPIDNVVSGVKGNAETDYRNGQVNVTPENVGAVPANPSVTSGTSGSLVLATSKYYFIRIIIATGTEIGLLHYVGSIDSYTPPFYHSGSYYRLYSSGGTVSLQSSTTISGAYSTLTGYTLFAKLIVS